MRTIAFSATSLGAHSTPYGRSAKTPRQQRTLRLLRLFCQSEVEGQYVDHFRPNQRPLGVLLD